MNSSIKSIEFYTAGGTLSAEAPSYVKRAADKELYNAASNGDFCYILTPRQMGKSSLMIRTASKLEKHSRRTAIIDLTQIGTVSIEQWYLGILTQAKKRLNLKTDVLKWWEEKGNLSAVQKFTDFLQDILLTEIPGKVVIFIDEIDTTLKLKFTDDFFAAIRSIYNSRAKDTKLNRLTFVLLGVASPADLISDHARTPFNVGQEIILKPFSREEGVVLEKGLNKTYPKKGRKILDKIFHWTNGHPYLTQKLCQVISESKIENFANSSVDDAVKSLFLSDESKKETNLQFIRDKLLNHPQKRKLLNIYSRIYKGQKILDNKKSQDHIYLKLSGLLDTKNSYLSISNEIYRQTFDLEWIRQNSEINWLPYTISLLLATLLLFFYILIHDAAIDILATRAETCITINYPELPREKSACFAKLFSLSPLYIPSDYVYKANVLFFDLQTWEEQKALFTKSLNKKSDIVIITRGLYISLADVNNDGESTKLLTAMRDSLDKLTGDNDIEILRKEIAYWVEARELYQKGRLKEALIKYNQAISLNSDNPSTLYEQAKVLSQLGFSEQTPAEDRSGYYEQALENIDKILQLTLKPSSTGITSTPDVLSTIAATLGVSVVPSSTQSRNGLITSTQEAQIDYFTQEPIPPSSLTMPSASPSLNFATSTSTPYSTSTLGPNLLLDTSSTAIDLNSAVQTYFLTYQQRINALNTLIFLNPNLIVYYTNSQTNKYPQISTSNLIETSNQPLPSISTALPTTFETKYFSETGHNIKGDFQKSYISNPNATFLYGYPITEEFTSKDGKTVQYFQRARFELRSDLPEGQRVQLTELGQLTFATTGPLAVSNTSACRVYAEAGYSICFAFLEFFDQYGGVEQFGYPISNFEYHENRIVQYFQKARLEWQPWKSEGQRVVVSDLGRIYFDKLGEDPDLLSPVKSIDSSPNVATSLQVRAFAWKAVSLATDDQLIFVIVQDQDLQPIANASCTAVVHWPDDRSETISITTNANGVGIVTLSFVAQPYGSIINTDITCTSTGLSATATTSFRIWY